MLSSARMGEPAAPRRTTGSPAGPESFRAASPRRSSAPRLGRGARRPAEELQRARLGRVAAHESQLREVREMRVDGRRRGETDRLPDVAHRRRVAVPARVLLDELEDLLLALLELQIDHLAPRSVVTETNMCSHTLERGSDDIKADGRSEGRL